MKKNQWLKIFLFLSASGLVTKSSVSQVIFDPHEEIVATSSVAICITDDFDNDSLTDLILASNGISCKFFIYRQANGELLLHDSIQYRPSNYWYIRSITSGNLNRDGLKDLVIAYRDSIKIYFQDSVNGFFNESDFVAFQPDSGETIHGIASGDLNNDGRDDLAIALWNIDTIYLYYQDSISGFTEVHYYKHSSNNELLITDLNNDGLNDLFVSNGGTFHWSITTELNSFALYLQDSITHLLSYPRFFAVDTITGNSWIANTVSGIGVGDLNNDGYKDVVTSFSPGPLLHIWHHVPGHPDFFPNPPDTVDLYTNAGPVYIKDLNKDNRNEIIVGHSGWNLVSVFESDSAYQFESYTTYPISSGSLEQNKMAVEDLNDDSFLDILTSFGGGASILYNKTWIPVEEIQFRSKPHMTVYPNPACHGFHLELNSEFPIGTVELKNAVGQAVFVWENCSLSNFFDLDAVPEGFYCVTVHVAGKSLYKKLIVVR